MNRTLSSDPSVLEELTGHLSASQIVFIDEIQKIPELLDEVHFLIGVGDIDFIIETKRKSISKPAEFISIEVKLAKKWDAKFEKMTFSVKEKN